VRGGRWRNQAELAALRQAAHSEQPWEPWADEVAGDVTTVAPRMCDAEHQLRALGLEIAVAEAAMHTGTAATAAAEVEGPAAEVTMAALRCALQLCQAKVALLVPAGLPSAAATAVSAAVVASGAPSASVAAAHGDADTHTRLVEALTRSLALQSRAAAKTAAEAAAAVREAQQQQADGSLSTSGGVSTSLYHPPWWVLNTSALDSGDARRLERARLAVHRTILDATSARSFCRADVQLAVVHTLVGAFAERRARVLEIAAATAAAAAATTALHAQQVRHASSDPTGSHVPPSSNIVPTYIFPGQRDAAKPAREKSAVQHISQKSLRLCSLARPCSRAEAMFYEARNSSKMR
jgi:hypothetical protein